MFVVDGKYRVLAPVAEGGMGAVYSAVHISTGRHVALKILHEERAADEQVRARFEKEARIVGALLSPNITKVLDSGTDGTSGLPYIVMELLEGEDLNALLKRRGKLPVGLVLVIAAHIAAGLTEAHEADVVHRDIKPANVVLSSNVAKELVAKVIDFGIARTQNHEESVLTRTGDFMGSLPYMSPEQLSGERVDATTDVWSLGILMYEALCGERPTGGEQGVANIVRQVCMEDIPNLLHVAPWVPPGVAAVVHRALQRERGERFQTIREMHDVLLAFLNGRVHFPYSVIENGEEIAVANILLDDTTATLANAPVHQTGPLAAPRSSNRSPEDATLLSGDHLQAELAPAPDMAFDPTVSATLAATAIDVLVPPPHSPRTTGPMMPHMPPPMMAAAPPRRDPYFRVAFVAGIATIAIFIIFLVVRRTTTSPLDDGAAFTPPPPTTTPVVTAVVTPTPTPSPTPIPTPIPTLTETAAAPADTAAATATTSTSPSPTAPKPTSTGGGRPGKPTGTKPGPTKNPLDHM